MFINGKKVRLVLETVAVAALFLCASPANACERCGLFGNRCALRKAVVVQQVVAQPYAYPQVNYFVGAPIRVEAIVQKALQDDPTYKEFQQFRVWKAIADTKPDAPAVTAQPEATKFAALIKHCAECHGGSAPAKGLLLTGEATLTCDQYVKVSRKVNSGAMPPPKSHPALTGEQKGDVLQDALDLVETK